MTLVFMEFTLFIIIYPPCIAKQENNVCKGLLFFCSLCSTFMIIFFLFHCTADGGLVSPTVYSVYWERELMTAISLPVLRNSLSVHCMSHLSVRLRIMDSLWRAQVLQKNNCSNTFMIRFFFFFSKWSSFFPQRQAIKIFALLFGTFFLPNLRLSQNMSTTFWHVCFFFFFYHSLIFHKSACV